jgi:hypothetical protein
MIQVIFSPGTQREAASSSLPGPISTPRGSGADFRRFPKYLRGKGLFSGKNDRSQREHLKIDHLMVRSVCLRTA